MMFFAIMVIVTAILWGLMYYAIKFVPDQIPRWVAIGFGFCGLIPFVNIFGLIWLYMWLKDDTYFFDSVPDSISDYWNKPVNWLTGNFKDD